MSESSPLLIQILDHRLQIDAEGYIIARLDQTSTEVAITPWEQSYGEITRVDPGVFADQTGFEARIFFYVRDGEWFMHVPDGYF